MMRRSLKGTARPGSGLIGLGLTLAIGTGCSTIIGLGDYTVDAGASGASGSSGASAGGSSGMTGVSGEAGVPGGGTSGGGGSSGGGGASGAGTSGTGGSASGAAGEAGAAGGNDLCPNNCDDGVDCTVDVCGINGCTHTPAPGTCPPTGDPCIRPTCSLTTGCGTMDISTTRELLTNGNFDGAGTWLQQSGDNTTGVANNLPLIVTGASAGVVPQSAPNIARLGQIDEERGFVYQTVTLPTGTVNVTVSGYYHFTTTEVGTTVYDEGWIDLYTALNAFPMGGTGVEDFIDAFPTAIWGNQNTVGWTQFTIQGDGAVVSRYAGQDLLFVVAAGTDVSNTSDFMFDSLTLTAKICQ